MAISDILKQFGVKVEEDSESLLEISETVLQPPILESITRGDKLAAMKLELVPEYYIDCEFSIDAIQENIRTQLMKSARKFRVRNFKRYKDITEWVISTIIANRVPDRSLLIGAPNGFGKTSFANDCILRLYKQGRRCAPYISLSELAQIKNLYDKRLAIGLTSESYYKHGGEFYTWTNEGYEQALYDGFEHDDFTKSPIEIINKFSWSEFINCSVLFCYFTDVRSKVIESEIFKTILTLRGAKGLPTIGFISSSLNPYKADKYLAEYVWDEILEYRSDVKSLDRVVHISCYKDYNLTMAGDSEVDE